MTYTEQLEALIVDLEILKRKHREAIAESGISGYIHDMIGDAHYEIECETHQIIHNISYLPNIWSKRMTGVK